jgi:hypothetical protein
VKNPAAAPESTHRSKLRLVFFQHVGRPKTEKNALHGCTDIIEWLRGRLAAPIFTFRIGAQIVNYHGNGLEWALPVGRGWILGFGYSEAAPTGVTRAGGGTE